MSVGRNKNVRFVRMAISGNDHTFLSKKNPWMPMWWSAALPGLGHLRQGSYLKGLILVLWELLVNFKAHLNLSILYTFTGQFDKARAVLDPGWALFYGVIFCFAIFDSYRIAVEMNMITDLEQKQEKRHYEFMHMSLTGVNYLDRGNPWVAASWSALLTGFGHLYNMKAVKALILLAWAVAIIAFSHINEAIIATFNGNFEQSSVIVNYQWLLFFPSIYFFAIWDSYNDAVEMNKVFGEAQKAYLREVYGSQALHLKIRNE